MPFIVSQCADGCNSSSPCCPLSTQACNANSQFLMSPVSNAGEMKFSQCSLGNICKLHCLRAFRCYLNCVVVGSLMQDNAQGKTNTSCLLNPDPSRQTISLQMCGNGIVEAGEDCDPGKDSSSICCNSTTCKFTSGSVCDPLSSQCCTSKCTFAPPTQVCRPSKDSQCDAAEMCTGNSSACPSDVTAPNGKSVSFHRCLHSRVTQVKAVGRTVWLVHLANAQVSASNVR
jgi:hypothetical protein